MLKLLGFIDLVCVIGIILYPFIPAKVIVLSAILLMGKGAFFWSISAEPASLIDIFLGVYMLLILLGIKTWLITLPALIYLSYKGMVSIS